jgi:hypothetical protein
MPSLAGGGGTANWSAANGNQFALEALLAYGLIQEEPYENRTDLVP